MSDLAPELVAEGVSVRFGGLVAIDNVSITLSSGQILGLIGPNGAGKTTLVNVLSGFQRPHAGVVRLGQRNLTEMTSSSFAQAGIVRTFQAVRLFRGLTVSENIETSFVARGLGRSKARQEALSILAAHGLQHRAHYKADALSYGEERRIGLVRALALRPKFLLLDEPAAGLAATEAADLATAIRDITAQHGCGIVVIEHNMAMVMKLCDRIHVLDSGRTIATGTPDEVKANPSFRRAYLGSKAA